MLRAATRRAACQVVHQSAEANKQLRKVAPRFARGDLASFVSWEGRRKPKKQSGTLSCLLETKEKPPAQLRMLAKIPTFLQAMNCIYFLVIVNLVLALGRPAAYHAKHNVSVIVVSVDVISKKVLIFLLILKARH